MASIPNFNKNEMWNIHDTLKQRYRKDIEVQKWIQNSGSTSIHLN